VQTEIGMCRAAEAAAKKKKHEELTTASMNIASTDQSSNTKNEQDQKEIANKRTEDENQHEPSLSENNGGDTAQNDEISSCVSSSINNNNNIADSNYESEDCSSMHSSSTSGNCFTHNVLTYSRSQPLLSSHGATSSTYVDLAVKKNPSLSLTTATTAAYNANHTSSSDDSDVTLNNETTPTEITVGSASSANSANSNNLSELKVTAIESTAKTSSDQTEEGSSGGSGESSGESYKTVTTTAADTHSRPLRSKRLNSQKLMGRLLQESNRSNDSNQSSSKPGDDDDTHETADSNACSQTSTSPRLAHQKLLSSSPSRSNTNRTSDMKTAVDTPLILGEEGSMAAVITPNNSNNTGTVESASNVSGGGQLFTRQMSDGYISSYTPLSAGSVNNEQNNVNVFFLLAKQLSPPDCT
jgi:hypothetical protein